MKKANRLLWGVLFLLVGAILTVNALGIADITLFFEGWWTLFIIVPNAINLFTQRNKAASLLWCLFGVVLLLCCQEVLSFSLLWKLVLPAAFLCVGIKLLFGALFRSNGTALLKRAKQQGSVLKNGTAVFSGCDMHPTGEAFEGGELNAVFGGVSCDLHEAVITKDCAIRATAIFGGIDIVLPENVCVKVSSFSLFGGVDNQVSSREGEVTVYITATAIFGGIDVQ